MIIIFYDVFLLFSMIILLFSEGGSKGDAKEEYNPWPHFPYTGKLRPFPRDSLRTVPESIGRPDYATHPTGVPLSEQAVKGSAYIKTLDDEEIEGMRVACKVVDFFFFFFFVTKILKDL